jgi:transcriptional regulator with XRE-family HTH domain
MNSRYVRLSEEGMKQVNKKFKVYNRSQEYLAGASESSRQTVSSLLRGEGNFEKVVVERICVQLGLELTDIIEKTDSVFIEPVFSSMKYHKAIENATERIWICQTWFPGIEYEGRKILEAPAPNENKRILLLSFKENSPIHGRILVRDDMTKEQAQYNSKGSIMPFIQKGLEENVRFNYAHHPGWIAIIDSLVIWGVTPVKYDSHNRDFLFHKHSSTSLEGQFWIEQFETIWEKFSHSFDEEKQHNSAIKDLQKSPDN